jgi:putative ubiquitin-RnfH superfamily antitoxin RatB of RatAB toxin-antitoxin module
MATDMMAIEVVYALPERQLCINLRLAAGANVGQAIAATRLAGGEWVEIDAGRVGIFSRLCRLDTLLSDGDRVEIYRPLQVDPKEARRRRAARKKLG